MNFIKLFKIFLIFISIFSIISCGKLIGTNPIIPGIKGPYLKFIKENLILQLSAQIELPYKKEEKFIKIPKLSKSKIHIFAGKESGNLSLEINLDITELLNLSPDSFAPKTLPGGRPIPGINYGVLPSVAISIPSLKNISFYIGRDTFGFFIPVPKLSEYKSITTVRFRIKGKRVGNISVIGSDYNSENAGVLLLIDSDESVKKSLRKLIYKY